MDGFDKKGRKVTKMKVLFRLSIMLTSLLETTQDAQYLDFGNSLDAFQNCSIHLIQSDLEVK